MPGGRSKTRRKNKGQNKDVSFRFHSGGSLERGAYLSEGDRESAVFSDSLDELEEEPKRVSKRETSNKNSFITDHSTEVEDQKLVRELLESAIEDTGGNATHFDQPSSDPLFEFDQEPDKKDYPEKDCSIQTSPTKELEYKETYSADEQRLADFEDSGDFMNIKDSSHSKAQRLLDSDDEELFFSITKETVATMSESVDGKVTATTDIAKSDGLESDNDSIPTAVSPSPFKGNTSDVEDVTALVEVDTTVLADVDTHPLVSTGSAEGLDIEAEIKDNVTNEINTRLLLTEEHFNVPAVSEPTKKIYQSPKTKPKRPPPPRPSLPPKGGKPSVVVSDEATNVPSKETSWDDSDGIIVKQEPCIEAKPSPSVTSDEEKAMKVVETVEEESSEIVRDNSLSLPYFITYTLIIFLYYSLNPSPYLAGFLTGFLFFFVTSAVVFIWYVNYLQSIQQQEREAVQKSQELSSQQLIDQLDEKLSFKKTDKFGIRFDYDAATHHYSDNTPARVKLEGFILTLSIKKLADSEEHVLKPSQTEDWSYHHASSEIVKQLDLRDCGVAIVPDEVAQNRKRRWSRKFPICVCYKQTHHKNHSLFLFSPTAKYKEMWFRQMKMCSEGLDDKEIAAKREDFYLYMKYYMPHTISDAEKLKPEKKKKKRSDGSSVRYSMKSHEDSAEEEGNSSVSIAKRSTSVKVNKPNSIPPTVVNDMDWLNTALARVCWDIWHEKRWYNWVEAKIQRRISRIKTPSWMEPLSVAEIQLGKTIPTIKRIYAPPKLDSEGVWIYLAVQYKGSFTMTLKTKLKLGKGQKDETDSHQPDVISGHDPKKPPDRQRKPPLPNRQTSSSVDVDVDDTDGNHTNRPENSVLGKQTFTRNRSLPQSISSISSVSSTSRRVRVTDDTDSIHDSIGSDLDSGSDDDMSVPSSLSSSPNINQLDNSELVSITSNVSSQAPYPSKPAKWKNMFDWLKNSTIVQKAANTRIVRMAAEKMSSYNLYLTVEVKALDGFLAVNMSPPPSDILWYGFQWKPRLDLSAKPKLGQREVTLHYVTEWIENKLRELLEKQMVLPNMESIAIPILNSGIPGDAPYKLPRLSSTPK